MKPEASALIEAGYQRIGISYKVMDCQAFIEACLKEIGVKKDLAGSNAWYRAMGWVGSPEECARVFGRIPDGAFLFIWKDDGGEVKRGYKDGLGNASHIGIYTGSRGKGAVHSSESNGMVCESVFKGRTIKGGWNRVGLWLDMLDYGITDSGGGDTVTKMVTWADNSSPINMRVRKSTSAQLAGEIPQGETVEAEDNGDGWSWVHWNGKAGYVLTRFLKAADAGGGIDRERIVEIYHQLGKILGLEA